MPRWLRPAAHHSLTLFVVMGALSIIFAWNTFDLVQMAMANVDRLEFGGLMAAVDGALMQTALLAARGMVSLLCYLGFKGIEDELTDRWRR